MANMDVVNWKNSKVGQVNLSPEVFEKPVDKGLIQTVVRWQLAKRRQGTHSTKTKGLVRGGGAKPYRQKGTGNARRGSSRSPLIRGGGVIFGPKPRDYSYTLPKKLRAAGLKSTLSYLFSEGKLKIVESLECKGKTKDVFENLKSLGFQKTVCVGSSKDSMFQRASKNLPECLFLTTEGLNVYDLLKYDHLVLSQGCVDFIHKKFQVEA